MLSKLKNHDKMSLNKFFYNFFIDNNTRHWRVRKLDYAIKKWAGKIHFFLHTRNEKLNSISLVVVGRNDNYGGDFSARLKTTIDWNYNQFPNTELIYVEWNTIEDRPSETEWIAKRYPNAKCYIVPENIHQQYAGNPKIKMMEYFAKNLGVRKASNEWIAIVNADVLIGKEAFNNLNKVNKEYAYGTHYINIKWNGEEITESFLNNKAIEINRFSTNTKIMSVVGNFLLMHKSNWLKMKGYDENLKDVRLGVDNNGLKQIYYLGIKTAVAGYHYHLDHSESAIKGGSNPTHGSNNNISTGANIPYHNPESWGLNNYPLEQISERVWRLALK